MDDAPIGAVTADYPHSGQGGEREGLRPLREHRAFIAVFVLSAVLSALALTYVYSERYKAAATIFFKPSDVTEVNRHGQEAFGSRLPVPTQKNVTQTITQLATSDPVLRRVVTDLHLDVKKPRDLTGPWYRYYYRLAKYEIEDYASDAWKILQYGYIIDDPVGGAMYKLYKSTKITNDESYIYTVTVSADSLAEAARQAEKLVEVVTAVLHRDDRLEYERRSAELARLRDEKARDIERLEAATQKLLTNNQVATVYDAQKTLTESLSKIREQWAGAQADLEQSDAKVAAAAEKLRVAIPLTAPDNYPAPAGRGSRISPEDYGKLTTTKLEAEVDGRGLRAKVASYQHSYAALVPRIQVLTDVQAQSDLLAAKLASAKNDYKALTDGIQELVIRQTTGASELHVQAEPNGMLAPVSPIKIYHVGAAAALAALVAVGLAYVLDYFEIRLFLPPAGGRRRRRPRPLPEPAAAPGMSPGIAD